MSKTPLSEPCIYTDIMPGIIYPLLILKLSLKAVPVLYYLRRQPTKTMKNSDCGSGQYQSPIHINDTRLYALGVAYI